MKKDLKFLGNQKNEPINEIKQKASRSRKSIKKEPKKVKKNKKINFLLSIKSL